MLLQTIVWHLSRSQKLLQASPEKDMSWCPANDLLLTSDYTVVALKNTCREMDLHPAKPRPVFGKTQTMYTGTKPGKL